MSTTTPESTDAQPLIHVRWSAAGPGRDGRTPVAVVPEPLPAEVGS